jgi:hypothetical protein
MPGICLARRQFHLTILAAASHRVRGRVYCMRCLRWLCPAAWRFGWQARAHPLAEFGSSVREWIFRFGSGGV